MSSVITSFQVGTFCDVKYYILFMRTNLLFVSLDLENCKNLLKIRLQLAYF